MNREDATDLRKMIITIYQKLDLSALLEHMFNGSHVGGPHLNGVLEDVIFEKVEELEAIAAEAKETER